MGIDIGFDLHPPLTTEAELRLWSEAFLPEVRARLADHPCFAEDPDRIMFLLGEGPKLPADGRYFRRFSSKVSGSCGDAAPVILAVTEVARRHFGEPRVHFWDEGAPVGEDAHLQPVYSWVEVDAVAKEFREMRRAAREAAGAEGPARVRGATGAEEEAGAEGATGAEKAVAAEEAVGMRELVADSG